MANTTEKVEESEQVEENRKKSKVVRQLFPGKKGLVTLLSQSDSISEGSSASIEIKSDCKKRKICKDEEKEKLILTAVAIYNAGEGCGCNACEAKDDKHVSLMQATGRKCICHPCCLEREKQQICPEFF